MLSVMIGVFERVTPLDGDCRGMLDPSHELLDHLRRVNSLFSRLCLALGIRPI